MILDELRRHAVRASDGETHPTQVSDQDKCRSMRALLPVAGTHLAVKSLVQLEIELLIALLMGPPLSIDGEWPQEHEPAPFGSEPLLQLIIHWFAFKTHFCLTRMLFFVNLSSTCFKLERVLRCLAGLRRSEDAGAHDGYVQSIGSDHLEG